MPKVQVRDIEIYYEIRGRGEPLLLIMGTGVDHRSWAPQIEAFAAEFTCILFDNRGTGRTSMPETGYTSREMADDTAALMDAIGVPQAHVAGLSLGSAIGQELAINHPQKVKSLSLYATWDQSYPLFRTRFRIQQDLLRAKQYEALAAFGRMTLFSPDLLNEREADAKALMDAFAPRDPEIPNTPGRVMLAHWEADILHDTADRLHQIRAPTLVVVGSDDPLTRLEYAQSVHRRIPESELQVLEGADHMMTAAIPDAFNAVALEFLRRQRTVGAEAPGSLSA